jgi:hypothetical protein
MKIIAFIEAHQEEVIRKVLQHCGLWHVPPTPRRAQTMVTLPGPEHLRVASPWKSHSKGDPEFLEHARHQQLDEPDLPLKPEQCRVAVLAHRPAEFGA